MPVYTTEGGVSKVLKWLDNGIQPMVVRQVAEEICMGHGNPWPEEARRALDNREPVILLAEVRSELIPLEAMVAMSGLAFGTQNVVVFVYEPDWPEPNPQIYGVFTTRLGTTNIQILGVKIPEFQELRY